MIYELGDRKPVLEGDNFVAPNAAVIGKNCLIAAGALIPEGKHVPDGSLVMGVPGKVVRPMSEKDIADNTWIAEHYVERSGAYLSGLKPVG